jgi:hypothetical protein
LEKKGSGPSSKRSLRRRIDARSPGSRNARENRSGPARTGH